MDTRLVLLMVAMFGIGAMTDAKRQMCVSHQVVEDMDWAKVNDRWYEVSRSGEARPENIKCSQTYVRVHGWSYALTYLIKNITGNEPITRITKTSGDLVLSPSGRVNARIEYAKGMKQIPTLIEVLAIDYDNFALIHVCAPQVQQNESIIFSRKATLDSNSQKRIDEVLKKNGLPTSDTFHATVQDCGRIKVRPEDCPKVDGFPAISSSSRRNK